MALLPIFSHLQNHMNVKGKNVLVIGTQLPWIEAILLEMGVRHITILGKNESSKHNSFSKISCKEIFFLLSKRTLLNSITYYHFHPNF